MVRVEIVCRLGLLVSALLGLARCSPGQIDPAPPVPAPCSVEGDSCDDNNPCTQTDTCRAGICEGSNEIVCDLPGICEGQGVCNPNNGQCEYPAAPNGSSCDDNNPCTQTDTCRNGLCLGADEIECTTEEPCRESSCDPQTGTCRTTISPELSPCDDGDACTRVDLCQQGSCVGRNPVSCSATTCRGSGQCDPSTGLCDGAAAPNGTSCDDNDACTQNDACQKGECTGATVECVAGPCELATCNPSSGCQVTTAPDATPCEDGNACTLMDVCVKGQCTAGAPHTCTSTNPCQLATGCDPAQGCMFAPLPDGSFCDDNDECSRAEECQQGACVGTELVDCSARDVCELDGTCDPNTGFCSRPVLQDGTACNDENLCTQSDMCESGVCTGMPAPVSGTRCQDGICFTDVTVQSGITWTSSIGGTTRMSAAGAFLDFNMDGLLDVLLGAERGPPALYQNNGDGTFTDVSPQVGFPSFSLPSRFMGFAVADYDNDSDPDIYMLVHGPNHLLRNNGNGTFTDVTQTASVADPAWSTAGAFGDYDQDGDLDLYVGNYVGVSNYPFHQADPNTLYQNNGDGTFTSLAMSQTASVAGGGTTLAVTWSDFDDDGDLDLLVCNDFGAFVQPNQLYRNDNAQGFTQIAGPQGFDLQIYCMGIAPGDFDRDLDLDYYFSNLGRNVLLQNNGGAFIDITSTTAVELTNDRCLPQLLTTSWGVAFHDFDNDSFLDLYVSNGFVPAATEILNAELSENSLFKGDGVTFTDISHTADIANTQIGRGAAFGDFDNDGDVDILQINVNGPPLLLRNDSPAPGAFLTVDLVGRRSSAHGNGARLVAQLNGGAVQLLREANQNYSFESASSQRVDFGLGNATQVDALQIRWPLGTVQTLLDVPADMRITVTEPALTIAQLSGTTTATSGAQITLEVQLRNEESTAQTGTLSVLPRPAGAAQSRSVNLGPGATITESFSVTAGAPGALDLKVTVDSAGAVDQALRPITVLP